VASMYVTDMQKGYSVRVLKENAVVLDPDVKVFFLDSERALVHEGLTKKA